MNFSSRKSGRFKWFLHMLLRKQSFTSNRLLKPSMHTHLSSLLTHRKNFSKYTIVITQRINNSGSPRYKESKTGSTEHPLLSDLPFSFNFLIALHIDGALKKILISLLLHATGFLVIVSLSCYLTVSDSLLMHLYVILRINLHKWPPFNTPQNKYQAHQPYFFTVVLASEQASALAISETAVQYLYIRKLHLFFSYQL